MPESNPLQPGRKFGNGRFVLTRFLGRGGMGQVWLAQDERLHEPVALKFLLLEIPVDPAALDAMLHETERTMSDSLWIASEALSDLRRETTRSRKLTHPNIMRIHDLHEEADGTAFIIMEYVEGSTLAGLKPQQPNRVFAWTYVRPLLEQLCSALDYAHNENVIHRDLKPANMMVDVRGRLKLADFGIAAAANDSMSRLTAQRATSGTLLYMSPQQLAGKRAQVTDDIYALGSTLYELLTSKPPFHTGDLTHQVLHEAPEPMAERLAALEIKNEIPPDVVALIMACLAKEPGQRPQSAQAAAALIGLETGRKTSPTASSQDVLPAAPPAAAAATAVTAAPDSSRKSLWAAGVVVILLLLASGGWYLSKHSNDAWKPLFDGKTLSGWKAPDGQDWKVEGDGSISSPGTRSSLYSPTNYGNLELKAEIKLGADSDGGVGFRAQKILDQIIPTGYIVKQSIIPAYPLTGSLWKTTYANGNCHQDELFKATNQIVQPGEWFAEHIIVVGGHIVIKVNDRTVTDYRDTSPADSGQLVLQQGLTGATVTYRAVMVKPLPDNEAAAWTEAKKDMPDLAR